MKNIINKTLYRVGVFFYRQSLWSGLKQRPRMEKLCFEVCLLTFDLKYKFNESK